jgi:excisionase family DNA binding protein
MSADTPFTLPPSPDSRTVHASHQGREAKVPADCGVPRGPRQVPLEGSASGVVPCDGPRSGGRLRKRAPVPTGCTLTTKSAGPRVSTTPGPRDLLTVEGLAAEFRISKMGVYRLVERRALPFYRVGGVLRFDRRDVEEYLRRRRVGPAHQYATDV